MDKLNLNCEKRPSDEELAQIYEDLRSRWSLKLESVLFGVSVLCEVLQTCDSTSEALACAWTTVVIMKWLSAYVRVYKEGYRLSLYKMVNVLLSWKYLKKIFYTIAIGIMSYMACGKTYEAVVCFWAVMFAFPFVNTFVEVLSDIVKGNL